MSQGDGSEVKGTVREELRLCVEQQRGAHMDDCDREGRLWSSSNASRGEGVGLQFMKGAAGSEGGGWTRRGRIFTAGAVVVSEGGPFRSGLGLKGGCFYRRRGAVVRQQGAVR